MILADTTAHPDLGFIEAHEGTIEDEAFQRADAAFHQDFRRRCDRDRADACQTWAHAYPQETAKRHAETEVGWTEPLWNRTPEAGP